MKKFLGVMRYEYGMSIRRRSILVILLLFTAFYAYLAISLGLDGEFTNNDPPTLLSHAGEVIFFMNLFFPVIAGIASADRAVRDNKLGVREILRSTGVSNPTYVLGKYFGVALSMLSIDLAIAFFIGIIVVIVANGPVTFIAYCLLAGLILSGPGIFFITAFSLACPLVMPVRVYQILFTGYWYWGNYLSPLVMPTISDTILNAAGRYSLQGIFHVALFVGAPEISAAQAVANILVLLFLAGLALAVMIAYLGRSEKNA